jgi:hypothetical protein
MDTVTLTLHADLAMWLKGIAVKPGVMLHEATQQLLEEEKTRDLNMKVIEVPIGDCRWRATVPLRGLIYNGYETQWQRIASSSTVAATES